MGRRRLKSGAAACLLAAALRSAPAARVPVPAAHYAAPDAAPGGDGNRAHPFQLAAALRGAGGRIAPGDTLWLLGGTYRGTFEATLAGTPAQPVVVRQYPGARATIDGALHARGADVIYWGFEIMQSDPVANGNDALETYGPGCRFVNLIVHDAGKQGMSFWESAGTAEVYGGIFYNNGTHEELDHGIYVANQAGVKYVTDNVVFDNMAYGIHVYSGSRHPPLTDVHATGNVSFDNGAISRHGMSKANLLLGGDVPTEHVSADSNLLYFAGATGINLRLGLPRGDNRDVTVRDNYVAGGAVALSLQGWARATVTGNRLAGPADMVTLLAAPAPRPPPTGYVWRGNTYYRDPAARAWRYQGIAYDLRGWQAATGLGAGTDTAAPVPERPAVFVRPNRYEPGRATVVVYNWGKATGVPVDLSGVLRPGVRYEIRNVQDLFGRAVARGTYGGGPVVVPMTGVAPPVPIGRPAPPLPRTAPVFDVFIVTSGAP